jgi:hypothetical protein
VSFHQDVLEISPIAEFSYAVNWTCPPRSSLYYLVSISVRLSFWKETWLMFYNVWQLKALLLDSQRETFKKTKWSRSAKPVSQTTGLYTWKVRRVLYESLMQFCIEKSFLWFACGFACILVFLLMLLFYWGFSIIFLTKVLLVYVLL